MFCSRPVSVYPFSCLFEAVQVQPVRLTLDTKPVRIVPGDQDTNSPPASACLAVPSHPGCRRSVTGAAGSRPHERELTRCSRLASAIRQAGVQPPQCILSATNTPQSTPVIDQDLCRTLSTLVDRTAISLTDTISLWRNETPIDPRPNKALDPVWLDILLHGYRLRRLVVDTATHGVSHNLSSPRDADGSPARNHTSALSYYQALLCSLAEGQTSGTYLVINLPVALRWSELRFSPFGCVPKKDVDPSKEARLIHDLSHPGETSTNARSAPADLPDLDYESVRRIARRIEILARQFPHLPVKCSKVTSKALFALSLWLPAYLHILRGRAVTWP